MASMKKTHGVAEEAHFPTFQACQNPAELKRLYTVLVHLSSNPHLMGSTISHSGLSYPDVVDIQDLSDALFKELDHGFEELFSALHDVSSTRVSAIWAKREPLMLILRCCLVLLILLAFNQKPLIPRGRIVFANLKRLISVPLGFGRNENCYIKLKRSVSLECAYVDGDCTASVSEEFVASISPMGSPLCFVLLCSLLEVFAHELLLHELLGSYFMLINSSFSKSGRLFNFLAGHGSIGIALEVICAHFILSVSNEQAFAKSVDRLYWCNGEHLRAPEISLPAALSLLLSPVLSAPKLFQAHLILLVSETININTTDNMILDSLSMKRYLTAFERSVILYGRHMSSLGTEKSCFLGKNQPHFESFLLQVTVDKLHHLIAKSESSWDSYIGKLSFGKDSDLVGPSISYANDNMYIFDDVYKNEALLILTGIILEISSGDTRGNSLSKGKTNPQDICFLASLLKLMSSSLLQIIRHVRHTSCREYKYILENILSRFQQFSINLPVQNFLSEEVQSQLTRNKESKRMMLLHLLGVLSFSYARGMDFLVKGCLFTIMTLLNLFIIEEGGLSALVSLFSRLKSFSSETVKEVLAVRKSSLLISSKVQKIQDLYLRQRSGKYNEKGKQDNQAETPPVLPIDSVPEKIAETCNGETYLKCVLGENSKVDDYNDLADFIECKAGKDYSGWLKDREKYRCWKYEKRVNLRCKKKKKAMKYMGLVK